MNISFDTEFHNIYNPNFSSQESSRSLSSIGRSVNEDGLHVQIDDSDNIYPSSRSSSSSSTPSVAEERDTISLTPNAITPNLSHIMNICSISKIEQPSLLTADSGLTPLNYRNPKSSLSYYHNHHQSSLQNPSLNPTQNLQSKSKKNFDKSLQ